MLLAELRWGLGSDLTRALSRCVSWAPAYHPLSASGAPFSFPPVWTGLRSVTGSVPAYFNLLAVVMLSLKEGWDAPETCFAVWRPCSSVAVWAAAVSLFLSDIHQSCPLQSSLDMAGAAWGRTTSDSCLNLGSISGLKETPPLSQQ